MPVSSEEIDEISTNQLMDDVVARYRNMAAGKQGLTGKSTCEAFDSPLIALVDDS